MTCLALCTLAPGGVEGTVMVFVGFQNWELKLTGGSLGRYLLKSQTIGKVVSTSSADSGASAYRQTAFTVPHPL